MPENERPYCKRDYAKELIENGILNGFVAVYDNQIVGFCNADTKDNYFRLSRETAPYSWNGVDERNKILSIVCFTVEPDMRRIGIAKALLDCACQYAKKNGYDCGGPVSMYVNKGFDIIDIPNGLIARKEIQK